MLSLITERFGNCSKAKLLPASDDPMRGYKLCNLDRTRKYGVAANSLQMIRDKASQKFSNIDNPRIYVASDGTEVTDEDYFRTLDAQTLLVVASESDHVQTDFELIFKSIRSNHNIIETGRIIRGFVDENSGNISKWLKHINEKRNEQDVKILGSSRSDDPDWFLGQPDSIDTKEKLMRRRSQDRIRGYFYKTKDDLTKSTIYKTNPHARDLINIMLTVFQHFLQHVDYFSTYFNRLCPNRHPSACASSLDDTTDGESPKKRMRQQISEICEQDDQFERLCVALCNERGEFRCQGLWNETCCDYTDHTINPYASRENAILFQIWNLDHRIEISRSIIPGILATIEDFVRDKSLKCLVHKRKARMISILRYFLEIFTVDNLRLVHIVCHDKGVHPIDSLGGVLCDRCEEYGFLKKIIKIVENEVEKDYE